MLAARAPRALPTAVARCASRLKRKYTQAEVPFGLATAQRPARTFGVDEIFTNLVVVPQRELTAERLHRGTLGSRGEYERIEHVFSPFNFGHESIELQELFQPETNGFSRRHTSVRVLVVGSAGSGKTMVFTVKSTFDWANDSLWNDQFDIVVARELRHESVRNAKTVSELFQLSSHLNSDAELVETSDYIMDYPQHICLILDGLDETALEKCSPFVQDVILGKELVGIRLILTSRPTPDAFDLAKTFTKRVEVIGFLQHDIKTYIRNVLSSDHAERLIEEVDSNLQLAGMMATPILAKSVCELFEWRPQAPKCPSDILDLFILRIAESIPGNGSVDKHYQSWDDVPKTSQDLLLELGLFALKLLVDQKLVFTEADMRLYGVSHEALKMGVLVGCDSLTSALGALSQWRFSHLSFQEGFSAKVAAVCIKPNRGDEQLLVRQLGALQGHLSTFWIYLAAQLRESQQLEALINALLLDKRHRRAEMGNRQSASRSLEWFFFMNLQELNEIYNLLCGYLDFKAMCSLADTLLKDLVCETAGHLHIQALVPSDRELQDRDFLKTLLFTWSSLEPRANRRMLLDAIALVDASTAKDVYESPLFADLPMIGNKEDEQHVSTAVECVITEEEVLRNFNLRSFGGYESLLLAFRCYSEHSLCHANNSEAMPCFLRLLEKYGVDFDGCRLSIADCRAIGNVLVHHHHAAVKKVDLFDTFMSDGGLLQLAPGLKSCVHLVDLNLGNCNLTAASAHSLSDALSGLKSLERLYLSDDRIQDEGFHIIINSLCSCTNVIEADLSGTGLTARSLPMLCRLLHSWQKLRKIVLQRNDFSGASVTEEEACMAVVRRCVSLRTFDLPPSPLSGSTLLTVRSRV